MTGLLLIAGSSLFLELSTSLGRYETLHKKESIYAFGFLNALSVVILLTITVLFFGQPFTFTLASLPTFLSRVVIEILVVLVSLHAILKADRSTCSFLRTITIPLLLAVEFVMGVVPSSQQLLGIALILSVIGVLVLNHGLSRNGKLLSIFSAVLSTGSISLYKYDITHFNSVAAEQILTLLVVLFVLLFAARIKKHENVLRYLRKPIFILQSLAFGVGCAFASFAYIYAPASIISTSVRAFEVIGAILIGRVYFHEKHLWLKIVACILIVAGIALTVA